MVSALASGIEKLRLSTLHRYGILDTAERMRSTICKLAAPRAEIPRGVAFATATSLVQSNLRSSREIPRPRPLRRRLTQPDVFASATPVELIRDSRSSGRAGARFSRDSLYPRRLSARRHRVATAPRELNRQAARCGPRASDRDALEARLAETITGGDRTLTTSLHDDDGGISRRNPVATRILGYGLPNCSQAHLE